MACRQSRLRNASKHHRVVIARLPVTRTTSLTDLLPGGLCGSRDPKLERLLALHHFPRQLAPTRTRPLPEPRVLTMDSQDSRMSGLADALPGYDTSAKHVFPQPKISDLKVGVAQIC
jgi:hypothetical protein